MIPIGQFMSATDRPALPRRLSKFTLQSQKEMEGEALLNKISRSPPIDDLSYSRRHQASLSDLSVGMLTPCNTATSVLDFPLSYPHFCGGNKQVRWRGGKNWVSGKCDRDICN